MENPEGPFFHASYRDGSPLPRSACDHELFPVDEKTASESGCQFARISKYLFGLTHEGRELFRCFLDDPDALVEKYGWNQDVIAQIKEGVDWAGERLSSRDALERMKRLADAVINYSDDAILFLFSRKRVDFNVEVYSTPELDFIEGFIIAAIDSEVVENFISIVINEMNIIEIEGDYGLNEPPDDNPWEILYDGLKLTCPGQAISPLPLEA